MMTKEQIQERINELRKEADEQSQYLWQNGYEVDMSQYMDEIHELQEQLKQVERK